MEKKNVFSGVIF